MDRRNELQGRAYFVVGVFVLLALVIAYRVIKINIIEGNKWRAMAANNVKWLEVNADRGNIYSDDESLLATSLQFFEVRMDMTIPKASLFKREVDSLALMLSKTINTDKPASQWRKELWNARKKNNAYFFIGRNIDPEMIQLVRKFPIFRYGKYKGGYIETRYGIRKKPFNQLASRTIGTDRENAQKVGLEGYFDKFLKGPIDKRLMKRISNEPDLWVPVYDPSEFKSAKGDDIITTINIHLQDVVHAELEKQLIKSQAEAGTAVLMEVKTGAIKAISNLVLKDSIAVEVVNSAIANSSEPGSTFKLATVLAILEDSFATPETLVNINGGTMIFADKKMHDSEPPKKNIITLKEAFATSSNVGISKFAHDFYNKNEAGRINFRNRLTQFGLDRKSEIEIEGEPSPFIKDPVRDKKTWYGTTIPWMAHGYETTMTPLQILNFYNTVANNGQMMKPYLVSEIRNDNRVIKKFEPKILIDRIARQSSIDKVKDMMEEVFKTGTASALNSSHVKLAGKTGTTRVNYVNKDEYAKYNASFCGYFPADNPEYSMIVVLYNPKGAFYGAAVAAPVFKAVAEKTMAWRYEIAPVYNKKDSLAAMALTIPEHNVGFGEDFLKLFDYVGLNYKKKNQKQWVKVSPFDTKMVVEDKKISTAYVPDVIGMGARDAMYVLENLGLSVSIYGRGKVVRQSLLPGTQLKNQKIEIFLN